MVRFILFFMSATVGLLLHTGCGDDNKTTNSDNTQFSVKYQVQFLSPGAVKITHRDPNGNTPTNDPVTTNWEREYAFGDRVNALLDVEASEVSPTDQVNIRLAILINGNQEQQASATITASTNSTLSLTRP